MVDSLPANPRPTRARWRSAAAVTVAMAVLLPISACHLRELREPEPPTLPEDFDLCRHIDLGPLEDLSLTLWEEIRIITFPEGNCELGLRSAEGHRATLEATARFRTDHLSPRSRYESLREFVREREHEGVPMRPAGDVEGVGDQAEAFALQVAPEPGVRIVEYALVARSEHLATRVILRMGGTHYPSRDSLATAVHDITTGIIATAPPAPPPSPRPPRRNHITYNLVGIDLCEELDPSPLEDTGLTIDSAASEYQRPSGHRNHRSSCRYTINGGLVDLSVSASKPGSFREAERDYILLRKSQTEASGTGSRHYNITDLGERATADTEPSGHGRDWGLYVLEGDMLVSVWMYARADEAFDDAITDILRPLAENTLAVVPTTNEP